MTSTPNSAAHAAISRLAEAAHAAIDGTATAKDDQAALAMLEALDHRIPGLLPEDPAPAVTAPPTRETPPSTLRLTDQASAALWEAFLVRKAADPFLSYRQFASTVVLGGLAK